MERARETGENQESIWNGASGRAWVDAQVLLDGMFESIEALLVDAVCAGSPQRALDVGCGTGGTTLAVAHRLGGDARCVGVDVSEPMISAARRRAEREAAPVDFVLADAQRHRFEPASFDLIFSRFGVMFFDDPIDAFTNLRRAVRAGGELRIVAWRSAAENPFMTTAERAAAPLLPNLPPRRPDEPGQFAFADPRRVERILEKSGWTAIGIRPIDLDCTLPERDLVRYLTLLGPLGRALREVDEATRVRVVETVRSAFSPFVHGAEVRFTAACWLIGARAGAPHG